MRKNTNPRLLSDKYTRMLEEGKYIYLKIEEHFWRISMIKSMEKSIIITERFEEDEKTFKMFLSGRIYISSIGYFLYDGERIIPTTKAERLIALMTVS